MSDENMTNNEETAALFVSAQKKKKAEEEARKKAEEEQAKREAAEAEVRRMEEEVEERKRKAEEERIALEKAEQERAKKQAEVAGAIKESEGEINGLKAQKGVAGGKKKLPLIIGIAAAAVVALIVIICVAAGGGNEVVLDELQFDAQYVSSNATYSTIPVTYPSSEYSEITENEFSDCVDIHMEPNNSNIGVDVVLGKFVGEGELSSGLTKGLMGTFGAQSLVDALASISRNTITGVYGDSAPTNEDLVDVNADKSCYAYSSNFVTSDGMNGVCFCWIEPDPNGYYYTFFVSAYAKEVETAKQMCDLFTVNNWANALMLPGNAENIENDCTALINVDSIHMGIPVPAGRFEASPITDPSTGTYAWCDDNGAVIMLDAQEMNMTASDVSANRLEIMNSFNAAMMESGADLQFTDITQRNYVLDNIYDEALKLCAYYMDFDDVKGGVKYWERDYMVVWTDETTGNIYLAILYYLAPQKNQAEYQRLFDLAVANLKDI